MQLDYIYEKEQQTVGMNTKPSMSARFLSAPRPPALPSRRRTLDSNVERRLRSWIRSALQLPTATPIQLCEWISMDSRCVPHTLSVVVDGAVFRHFTIEKASERILEADVRFAAGAANEPEPTMYL
jgi:hypothetical protein